MSRASRVDAGCAGTGPTGIAEKRPLIGQAGQAGVSADGANGPTASVVSAPGLKCPSVVKLAVAELSRRGLGRVRRPLD